MFFYIVDFRHRLSGTMTFGKTAISLTSETQVSAGAALRGQISPVNAVKHEENEDIMKKAKNHENRSKSINKVLQLFAVAAVVAMVTLA